MLCRPGNEFISFSSSSALGNSVSGILEEKAGLSMWFLRSWARDVLRSRLAWWADLPAVGNGTDERAQGQGRAFFISSIVAGEAFVVLPRRGCESNFFIEIGARGGWVTGIAEGGVTVLVVLENG